MAINPTRQETRLKKTQDAKASLVSLEEKERTLIAEQDQRQVQTTLLENQIADLKSRNEATADVEAQAQQISVQYGQTSKILNDTSAAIVALRQQYPNIDQCEENQKDALARKQATYPAKLKRHLRKCRMHGWSDPRLVKGK